MQEVISKHLGEGRDGKPQDPGEMFWVPHPELELIFLHCSQAIDLT